MFITNNKDSFSLRWKENLVKHQKVSKYYDQDCLKNFIFRFMSLLRAPILKKVIFLVEIFLIFLKICRGSTSKAFNAKLAPQWKGRKSSYQVTQIWSLLCKVFTQILDPNFETNKVWRKLGQVRCKILFPETVLAKTHEKNFIFGVK